MDKNESTRKYTIMLYAADKNDQGTRWTPKNNENNIKNAIETHKDFMKWEESK